MGGATSGFSTNEKPSSYQDISLDLKVIAADRRRRHDPAHHRPEGGRHPERRTGRRRPDARHRPSRGQFLRQRHRWPDGRPGAACSGPRSPPATRSRFGLLFEIPIISQLLGSQQRAAAHRFCSPSGPTSAPIDQTTGDTKTSIKVLSNKDQVEDYLKGSHSGSRTTTTSPRTQALTASGAGPPRHARPSRRSPARVPASRPERGAAPGRGRRPLRPAADRPGSRLWGP